jgi:hypothetical protein
MPTSNNAETDDMKHWTPTDWDKMTRERQRERSSTERYHANNETIESKKQQDINRIKSGRASPKEKEKFMSIYQQEIAAEVASAHENAKETAWKVWKDDSRATSPIAIPVPRSSSAPFGGRRTGRRSKKGRKTKGRNTRKGKRVRKSKKARRPAKSSKRYKMVSRRR